MARNRMIKPSFCTSAQVLECSRNARLLFLQMLMFCDDCGSHAANLRQLKAECFPADDITITELGEWLDELIDNGLVLEYAEPGSRDSGQTTGSKSPEKKDQHACATYWYITGWFHQTIDKPQPPRCPVFNEQSIVVRGTFRERSENGQRTFGPKGKERKGKEEKGKEEKGKEENNIHTSSEANASRQPEPTTPEENVFSIQSKPNQSCATTTPTSERSATPATNPLSPQNNPSTGRIGDDSNRDPREIPTGYRPWDCDGSLDRLAAELGRIRAEAGYPIKGEDGKPIANQTPMISRTERDRYSDARLDITDQRLAGIWRWMWTSNDELADYLRRGKHVTVHLLFEKFAKYADISATPPPPSRMEARMEALRRRNEAEQAKAAAQ